jgi:hypothetical protein
MNNVQKHNVYTSYVILFVLITMSILELNILLSTLSC